MSQIDKSKMVLVHDIEKHIEDQPLETKKIGYYRDSWNRFKKNRASLVAFIIICVILLFVIIGPYLRGYQLPKHNKVEAKRLELIAPKMAGLEKIGLMTGKKKLTRGKMFLLHMYHDENAKGIIKSGIPQELIDDPNHPDYEKVNYLTVVVDHYRYVDYIRSYMPEDYFALLRQAETDPSIDPLAGVRRLLGEEEFNKALADNHIIDILEIIEQKDKDGNVSLTYAVRLKQFEYALGTKPEDTYFWFGTNELGNDLFTEIWKGARISLLMALAVLIVNTTIGLTIGAIVGYYGSVLDLIFGRLVEIISSIPFLSVISLLTLRFGSALWVIVVAFTATGWIGAYGTGRMQFYRFKNREYVLAARTLGASDPRIMLKHIFPNTLGYIVTGYALAIPAFVFTEATYSFLGIINYRNSTSIGMLIQQGQSIMATYPHVLLFPAAYIAILMIAFNLFGNGLRDAFNPSLRGAE